MKRDSWQLNKYSLIVAEELLSRNKDVEIKIVSNSMHPFIRINDVLIFKTKKNYKLKFGDIILCKQKYSGSLMIHRYYYKYLKNNQVFYVTKADKSLKFDYPVKEDNYLGVAIIKRRLFLNRIIIIISLLFFPILKIINFFLKKERLQ